MKEIPLFLSENPLQPLKQDTVGRIASRFRRKYQVMDAAFYPMGGHIRTYGRHTFGYLPPKAQCPNKDIPHAIPPIPDRIGWNELHVIHRQPFVGDFIPLELARGTQEGCCLMLQCLHVDVVSLTLHLEKRGFFVQFVLGHNVDFILSLAVPPSADACVGLASSISEREVLPLAMADRIEKYTP